MYQALDGPSSHGTLTVNTTTVTEVRVGASALEDRKAVTMSPKDGRIYLYFGGGTGAPTATTVQNNGIMLYRRGLYTFEAAATQDMWILAVNGTVNVAVIERA